MSLHQVALEVPMATACQSSICPGGAGSGPPKEHRPLAFKELIGWGRLEGDHHPVPPLPSMGGSKRQG